MPAPVVATEENRSRPAAPTKSAEITRIGPLGKPVGAVVAAAKVLRVLHASERPLNASEVARAAGLHRGTAYNILRTLQAESLVGYDEATRLLHGELAHSRTGVRRFTAQRLAGHRASADACGLGCPRRLGLPVQGRGAFVAAAAGLGGRRLPTRPVCHRRASFPGTGGGIGHHHGRVRQQRQAELQALFSQVAWYQKPAFPEFLARVTEAKQAGFAVDRGTMFQGITLISVPVLSPAWEPLLILTGAGRSHDLEAEALEPLCRAMQSAAARLSESVRLLRLE